MSVLFADRFYFVALLNRDDQFHRRAIGFHRGRQGMLTTSWVLTELADLLSKARTRQQVVPLIRDMRKAADCKIVAFSAEIFEEALGLYDQHRDKQWSLTDYIIYRHTRAGNLRGVDGRSLFRAAGFIALLK